MPFSLKIRYAAVPLLLLLPAATCLAQQTDISRFDLFTGLTNLNSPHVGLVESGFHGQFGVRLVKWMSLGFDYSISKGSLTLTPNLLLPSLQQPIAGELSLLAAAGQIPPSYALTVPASSLTQTFAGGPQFAYRRFKSITFFVRPSAGMIHEAASPHPTDPIALSIAEGLAPTGVKKDNAIFYGFGGGVDLLFSHHVALRIQGDFVHDHLFNDLLTDGRNTVRLSIGPCFNFGKNIAK